MMNDEKNNKRVLRRNQSQWVVCDFPLEMFEKYDKLKDSMQKLSFAISGK